MYEDDTVLLEESSEDLQQIVNDFGRACVRISLKINFGKIKVLVVGMD